MWVYESVYALVMNVPAQNNTINPIASMRNSPIKTQLGIYDAMQMHKLANTIGTSMARTYSGDEFLRSAKNDLLLSHF